uniref:39S ribosomal protein L52, mitochondrial n=1 Tax=Parastrongyloides trichosuri TaxID=131310 RepID=A0A0N4ZPM8_PARTI
MKFSTSIFKNLNKIHWDRRVWEIGYRGPHLPQRKATGRPNLPISGYKVQLLRERFDREYNVMRYLSTPYLTNDKEEAYWKIYGSPEKMRSEALKKEEQGTMPGKAKRISDFKLADKRVANIGNMLHHTRTVEDSLKGLIRRNRWD